MCDSVTTESVRRDLNRPHTSPPAARKRKRRSARGQSIVEFALLTPVLILLFASAADLGRAFTAYIAIGGAAREGAAWGSQNHELGFDEPGMEQRALDAAPSIWGVAPVPNARACSNLYANCEDAYGYSYVEVDVSYTFTPILGGILNMGPLTMTRTSQMRVIN